VIQYIGELIDRVKTSVMEWGANPHTPVVVRIGDFGGEMRIEHVKLRGGAQPVIILQCAIRQ
jgi:hypothetical protein